MLTGLPHPFDEVTVTTTWTSLENHHNISRKKVKETTLITRNISITPQASNPFPLKSP